MNKIILILIFFMLSNFLIAQQFNNAIIYVLNPDCKLCKSKTYDIQETIMLCSVNNIKTYFLFHKGISTSKAKKFTKLFPNYNTIEVLYDHENKLASFLEVNITPTVLLLNNNNEIIYKGAIDDKDIDIQISKVQKTVSYINNAINSYISDQKIDIPCTTPVGCVFR